ncbi:hypothetical protein ACFLZS_00915 [Patescibacteria group bacterium]
MRTDTWLRQQLSLVWENFFPEIKRKNSVEIKFGRRCRTRLGSIKLDKKKTIITINGLFKNEMIPDYVVTGTIAHELTHYAHGFSSPHRQLQKYPHKGGTVDKELEERGLKNINQRQKKWHKQNWANYVKKNLPNNIYRPRKRYVYKFSFWPF